MTKSPFTTEIRSTVRNITEHARFFLLKASPLQSNIIAWRGNARQTQKPQSDTLKKRVINDSLRVLSMSILTRLGLAICC